MPTIQVKVKPGARRSSFARADDGTWTAQVQAPPVDGRANDALVTLVARHFGCPRSAVTIRSGASSRTKRVDIDAVVDPALLAGDAAS